MSKEGKNSKHYDLFDGRYTLVVGSRGSIKVISNISHGKEMKINGRLKDNLRFVNLTRDKGFPTESYSLSDLLSYSKGDITTLTPLTEDDINRMLRESQPKLKDLTPDEVFNLDKHFDGYGNPLYTSYTEGYTREYKPVYHTKKSNGFLDYHFSVTTTYEFDNYYTHKQTKPFKDKSSIIISDLTNVSNTDLIEIRDLIVGEVERRSEITKNLTTPTNGTHIFNGKLIHGVIGYDVNRELNNTINNTKTDYNYYCEQDNSLS